MPRQHNKYFAKTVVPVILLVLILLQVSGCKQNPKSKVAERSLDLADRLTPASPEPANEVTATRQLVYVDSSLSMQGFVGEGPDGRSTFDEFLDSMPDVLPGCEVFRYGDSSQKEPAGKIGDITTPVQFDHQLHDRKLYSRGFNPDDVLINGLLEQKGPVLSILITDGVESDSKGQVNTAVVTSIRSWMNRGGVFAILMLKSKFSGKFYSERQRHLEDKVEIAARPFYAFVFSPSVREFEDLQEKLRRRFPQLKSLVFSDDAITCKIEMPTDSAATYAHESPPDKAYYWQMLIAADLQEDTEDPIAFRFSYQIKSNYPARQLGIRTQSKLHRWDASPEQFEAQGSPLQAQPAVESSDVNANGTGKTQVFVVRPDQVFQQAAQDDYRFYSIEQSVYIKEIDQDIGELSTPDDSSADSGVKTYRFQELMYALMDVHLKDRLLSRMSPHLYITVAKNK